MAPRKTYPPREPGLMDRLRGRPAAKPVGTHEKVTTKHSTNPITGTRKETVERKTHGGHGHAVGHAPATHQRRKPGLGDKMSGAMLKAKGEATGKPGVAVS